MAKPIKNQTSTGVFTPPEQKATTIYAYRVERLSTYEYQCYRLTRLPEGVLEEPWGKPTLLDLIMQKVFTAIKMETNDVFQANKKFVKS